MTNVIREDKSINAENFGFLLAQSNYNLSTVFRSRNHNETVANTPIVSADTTNDANATSDQLEEIQSRNKQYTFNILGASTNQIADLKDAEINVVASCYMMTPGTTTHLTLADVPRLGNHALLSLFSSIELYIDSTLIERIDYPGMAANAGYALRYPHSENSEKALEANGYISKLKNSIAQLISSSSLTGLATDGVYEYDNSSAIWAVVGSNGSATQKLRGLITQRIKLSDIFPCINTLPPIFNHSVTLNLTRASSNDIIASSSIASTKLKLNSFIDFKINQDCYIITDELRKAAVEYYSKPIETIFTKCKQIATGFISEPTASTTQTFNISVDSAYKNKLAVFFIPRTTNFTNQAISETKQKSATGYNDSEGKKYDTAQAPANSYTYGGLKSFTVYTMNGVKLFGFDMSRDGYITGSIETHQPQLLADIKQDPNNVKIANYQCVYREYLKAREQFGQIAEEGLDFVTFLKEYCIYCVDLSPFTIGAGENLRIEMVCDDWAATYNPYHENNKPLRSYMSKQIFTLFYSDKILRLLPNQNVELADLFKARQEPDETNQI